MKNLFDGALRYRNSFAATILISFLFTACKKEEQSHEGVKAQIQNEQALVASANFFRGDQNLSEATISELQQAKIATAKYNNIENAFRDNYVDINVVVPEMGYHYLKAEYLDGTFDHTKPEILVYNKEENGRMKLVALEYATPVSPDPPAGFTGNNDVWSVYQGVLWTLHAWVWEYNPAGVFNPTNPLVHVH